MPKKIKSLQPFFPKYLYTSNLLPLSMIGSLSRGASFRRVIQGFFLWGVFLVALAFLVATANGISAEDDSPTSRGGNALYVDDDAAEGGDGSIASPLNSIQVAVLVATEGDTIRVWDGHYKEPVKIKKGLTIIGNGTGKTHTEWLEFYRGNSVIMDLSIRCPSDVPAIWIKESVSNITILRCSVRGESPASADWGIYAKSLSDIKIRDCTFNNCLIGVEIQHCENIVIENCTFTNNSCGIELITSHTSRIINCTFVQNELGIHIYKCDSLSLKTLFFNTASSNIVLKNNHFKDNKKNIEEVKKPVPLSELAPCLVFLAILSILVIVFLVAYRKTNRKNSSNDYPRQYPDEKNSADRSKNDSHIPESPPLKP